MKDDLKLLYLVRVEIFRKSKCFLTMHQQQQSQNICPEKMIPLLCSRSPSGGSISCECSCVSGQLTRTLQVHIYTLYSTVYTGISADKNVSFFYSVWNRRAWWHLESVPYFRKIAKYRQFLKRRWNRLARIFMNFSEFSITVQLSDSFCSSLWIFFSPSLFQISFNLFL